MQSFRNWVIAVVEERLSTQLSCGRIGNLRYTRLESVSGDSACRAPFNFPSRTAPSALSGAPSVRKQMLTDAFAKTLNEELSKKYQVVDQAGPGTLKLDVALLDAEAATPGLRSITMVVPQMRLLSTGASLATGKFPFAGGAEAVAKITDSETGELLAAGVDRRVGGGSIKTAAQWQWGDAENVMKAWANMVTTNMYAYTSGEKKP